MRSMPFLHAADAAASRARSRAQALIAGLVVLSVTLVACESPPGQVTPTPTAAPIVIATAVPTWTPLTRPSATPAQTLVAQAPLVPTGSPPAGSPVAASPTVYVRNTEGQGLALRKTPGGAIMATLSDGTPLTATGEEQIS